MATSKHPTQEDRALMLRAIAQAKRGAGFVRTNPMVGAILVYKGKVISESYHKRFGGPHAERLVIESAQRKYSKAILQASTLYITLEPCSHQGKTPPCLPLLIASGIKRVVIGSIDPNPQEQGKSIKALRRAGITVVTGAAKEDCDYLIRAFAKWITTKRPFVTAKVGMSLDGKITGAGRQKYITNQESLLRVHEMRQEMDAVLVGVNTVISDNPLLSTRLPRKHISQPKKIILDSRLRTPASSAMLDENTIIACLANQSLSRRKALSRRGVDIIELPPKRKAGRLLFERMNITALLTELGKRGITSVIVEGGSYVFTTFINEKAIDEFYVFVAPHIYGATRLPFTYALQYTVELTHTKFEQLNDNILVRGYAEYN